jgi:hypothetical protein
MPGASTSSARTTRSPPPRTARGSPPTSLNFLGRTPARKRSLSPSSKILNPRSNRSGSTGTARRTSPTMMAPRSG